MPTSHPTLLAARFLIWWLNGQPRLKNRAKLKDMSIIAWIILGLIAGAIAKAILPGEQGGGWIVTIIIGIVGALLGGFLGGLIFGWGEITEFWSIKTWFLAIGGSLLVLIIWGFHKSKTRRA